ncbi:unnamed protein product [Rotaria sp. Silwood2]|nr:unnamed protein product [Rotaria sp. Silwood2]CAF4466040.1 unnamed protein product [Rotaria sp. Silwood2]
MPSEDSSSSVIECQSHPPDSINLNTASSSIIILSSNYIQMLQRDVQYDCNDETEVHTEIDGNEFFMKQNC